jgi:dTDP-4-dehydrorhamnose 3,5-epimerase-like enzyme
MTDNAQQFFEIIPRPLFEDHRGTFIKCLNGYEQGLPDSIGEVYACTGLPGQTRGNHYHVLATEWFTVVEGRALLILEDMTSGQRVTLALDARTPQTVRVPPHVAHQFACPADSDSHFTLIAYSSIKYDPSDTIPHSLAHHLSGN